ncbi:MAG: peroxidase family protein [Candidatus Thermoplasmatota archaeon]|nr:peroxidase family protein [Candidatus Thermoplasmatota archaeon]
MQRRRRWRASARWGLAIGLCILIILPSGMGATMVPEDYPTDIKPVDFYSANGSDVNPSQPTWGMAGTLLGRVANSTHDPNSDWMGLTDLPNPREISNIVCAQPAVIQDERGLSDFNWLWGQFITHEIDFTLTQNGRVGENITPEQANIAVAEDDPVMGVSGGSQIRFFRSIYVDVVDENGVQHREHPNSITTWIDGSVVYGSSEDTMNWLRTFEGGRMKVSENPWGDLLPVAKDDDDTAPPMSFAGFSADVRFIAGDSRANEHIALMSLHVLFLREHNRLADEIAERNPDWNDEDIFQLARKLVAAQIQAITYEEFLPSLGVTLDPYTGYDPTINPEVTSAFATVAFRMGHSQTGDVFLRLDEERLPIEDGLMSLFDGFWTTKPVTEEGGISPILRGMAAQTQPANDIYYGEDLRNHLFGMPGAGGMDLCAMDIQRGRDHGVPDYGSIREAFGLSEINNYSEITSDTEVSNRLIQAYGGEDLGHIDPFIGMLAEDHLPDSALGETMDAVIRDQFVRLRDGDPLYYENDGELESVETEISETRLAHVILRNTEIESLQCDVFFAEHNVDNLDCYLPNEVVEPKTDTDDSSNLNLMVLGIIGLAITGLLIMNFFGGAAREEE